MAKHPGDDGDWNLDAADPVRMSIKQRVDTQLGVTSPAVVEVMRQEAQFLEGITGRPDTHQFHPRPRIPGRNRLIP